MALGAHPGCFTNTSFEFHSDGAPVGKLDPKSARLDHDATPASRQAC